MGDPQCSLYSFWLEPMVDLEPGIAQERDMLASFNIQLEQNVRQSPVSDFHNALLCSAAKAPSQGQRSFQNVIICRSVVFKSSINLAGIAPIKVVLL